MKLTKESQEDFLEKNGYDKSRFVFLNPEAFAAAKNITGWNTSCVDLNSEKDIEVLGPGCGVCTKRFYENTSLKQLVEQMETRQETKQQSFEEKVEDFKPNQDKPSMLNTIDGRHDHLINLGFSLSEEYKGYINNDTSKFVPLDVVEELSGLSFTNALNHHLNTEWKIPVSNEEEADDIDEIHQEQSETEKIYEEVVQKVEEPTSQEIANAHVQQSTIEERENDLESLGFEFNDETMEFIFQDKVIHHSTLEAVPENDYDKFLAQTADIVNRMKNNLMPEKSVDEEIEEELSRPLSEKERKAVNIKNIELTEEEQLEVDRNIKSIVETAEKHSIEKPTDIIADITGKNTSKENLEKFVKPLLEKNKTNGFFSKLLDYKFQQLNLSITKKDDDTIVCTVAPKSFKKDPAFENLPPMILTGTVDELDKNFFNVLKPVAEKVSEMFVNADSFIAAAEKAEQETKLAKDKKEAVDKLFKAAEKYASGEKATDKTKLKKYQGVLDNDPDHSEAKKKVDELNKILNIGEQTKVL